MTFGPILDAFCEHAINGTPSFVRCHTHHVVIGPPHEFRPCGYPTVIFTGRGDIAASWSADLSEDMLDRFAAACILALALREHRTITPEELLLLERKALGLDKGAA